MTEEFLNRLLKPQAISVLRGRNDHRPRRFVQYRVQGKDYLVGDVEVNGQWHYATVRRDRVEVLG